MHVYNFSEFLARFMDPTKPPPLFDVLDRLPRLTQKGPWLAGGALRRTLLGASLDSDFDLFFRDDAQLAETAGHLVAAGARQVYQNAHQETWMLPLGPGEEVKVQLIRIAFYETAADVIDSFDFTITMLAFDGEMLTVGEHTLWDLGRRKLALHRLTYGASTLRRLIKYTRQGFTACNGVMADLLQRVANDPALIHQDIQYID